MKVLAGRYSGFADCVMVWATSRHCLRTALVRACLLSTPQHQLKDSTP